MLVIILSILSVLVICIIAFSNIADRIEKHKHTTNKLDLSDIIKNERKTIRQALVSTIESHLPKSSKSRNINNDTRLSGTTGVVGQKGYHGSTGIVGTNCLSGITGTIIIPRATTSSLTLSGVGKDRRVVGTKYDPRGATRTESDPRGATGTEVVIKTISEAQRSADIFNIIDSMWK